MNEHGSIEVAASNDGQFRSWNGEAGAYWVKRARRFDDGAARYHTHLLDAAAIAPEQRVLDIGCGSGAVTRDAARLARDGDALGVDLSEQVIKLARRLAEDDGVANIEFAQADAQVFPFDANAFDIAISRHGAMFFGDPVAAFGNIRGALTSGGRLVLLTWQPLRRNEWQTEFRTALAAGRDLSPPQPNPGSLSDPDDASDILGAAGFIDVRCTALAEPMYFGRDVDDAHEFISGQLSAMLAGLDTAGKARALDNLRASMAEHRGDDGVYYDSAAWLIEARTT